MTTIKRSNAKPKRMKHWKYISTGVLCLLLLSGCSQRIKDELTAPGNAGKLTVQFKTEALGALQKNESASTTDETLISDVKGYRFENGILREVLAGDNLLEDGTYAFYPTASNGDIYFVTNDTENLFGQVTAGTTTIDEFLKTEGATTALASSNIMMTGSITLSAATTATQTVTLRRSVARLDLVSPDSGVSVLSVTIRGVANRGYVFGQNPPASPASTEWTELYKEYPEPGVENHTEILTYLSEQAGTKLSAEVLVSFGGGLHRMVAEFPSEILRNRIYTLRIYGSGTQVSVSVGESDWENGSATDAAQNKAAQVNVESSTLSEGVTVSPARDSVFLPYKGADVQLAIQAEAGAEVRVDGTMYRTTTTVNPNSKALEAAATVTINSQRRIPGYKRGYIYLNTYLNGKYRGRIVVVLEPNPTQITGLIALDTTGTYDFGKYVDGELGRITLPEGKTATVEFASEEDPWAKVEQDNGQVRLLGGWRPNDPTANGRTQSCQLVIANTDGTDRETYEIRRKNWGLPVVEFGGNWWCKYNMRGNSKSFEDQISIQDDPVKSGSLAEHLKTCDTAELRQLLGDQYQGGYTNGLKLSVNGSKFYYAGIRGSAQNFGSIDAKSMTPDGYQIPDKEDFSAFGASTNYNLGAAGTSKAFPNTQGQQVKLSISQRTSVMLLGQDYGAMNFYEFATSQNGSCVLYGLGHQWSTTQGDVSKLNILYATSGSGGNSWGLEGYANGNNWWKFTAQNNTKTRTIRCIKTPVEYIY